MGVEAELIPGSGGIFEVKADGEVIYKRALTRSFPEKGEILKILEEK